jgi:hypothetical protein
VTGRSTPKCFRIPLIGIDIGQKRDPTAICVAELERRPIDPNSPEGRSETHFLVRYLERLALGMPYPEVARRLDEIRQKVSVQNPDQQVRVFVDATGVGAPVVDLLKDNKGRYSSPIWATYFTHGDQRNEDSKANKVTLGKAWLVSRLQTLLQCNRLHLPRTAESQQLARELHDYEIRVTEDANDRYGAFKVGTHDDLVTALGLAVQTEPVPYLGWYRVSSPSRSRTRHWYDD